MIAHQKLLMMKTDPEKNPAEFIENVINSYETQIENIEKVFTASEAVNDSSHHLFNDLNRSIAELSIERTDLNSKLRDNMAKNGSLRKNDYDCLMNDVFQVLNHMENEAKESFSYYLNDQKAMVKLIRENIIALKAKEKQSQKEMIGEFKNELENIMATQQRGKDMVISNFIKFQNMHNRLTLYLKQMLDKQNAVMCKDIKEIKMALLNEIQ